MRSRIPWSIQWSAALFLSGAALLTAWDLASVRPAGTAVNWTSLTVLCGIFGGIAFAVVKGQNWVRWLFVICALFTLWSYLTPCFCRIRTTPEEQTLERGISAIIIFAAVLCFLPSSNRYFLASKAPSQPSAPPR